MLSGWERDLGLPFALAGMCSGTCGGSPSLSVIDRYSAVSAACCCLAAAVSGSQSVETPTETLLDCCREDEKTSLLGSLARVINHVEAPTHCLRSIYSLVHAVCDPAVSTCVGFVEEDGGEEASALATSMFARFVQVGGTVFSSRDKEDAAAFAGLARALAAVLGCWYALVIQTCHVAVFWRSYPFTVRRHRTMSSVGICVNPLFRWMEVCRVLLFLIFFCSCYMTALLLLHLTPQKRSSHRCHCCAVWQTWL